MVRYNEITTVLMLYCAVNVTFNLGLLMRLRGGISFQIFGFVRIVNQGLKQRVCPQRNAPEEVVHNLSTLVASMANEKVLSKLPPLEELTPQVNSDLHICSKLGSDGEVKNFLAQRAEDD